MTEPSILLFEMWESSKICYMALARVRVCASGSKKLVDSRWRARNRRRDSMTDRDLDTFLTWHFRNNKKMHYRDAWRQMQTFYTATADEQSSRRR